MGHLRDGAKVKHGLCCKNVKEAEVLWKQWGFHSQWTRDKWTV